MLGGLGERNGAVRHVGRGLQRIEPSQQIGIAFPTGRFAVSRSWNNLLQRLPLGVDVRCSIDTCRIEVGMAEPISDDRYVDTGGNQMNCDRVAAMSLGT